MLGPGTGPPWEVRGGLSWAVAACVLRLLGGPWTWLQLGCSLLSCDLGRVCFSPALAGLLGVVVSRSGHHIPMLQGPLAPGAHKLPGHRANRVQPWRTGQFCFPPPWWVQSVWVGTGDWLPCLGAEPPRSGCWGGSRPCSPLGLGCPGAAGRGRITCGVLAAAHSPSPPLSLPALGEPSPHRPGVPRS